MHAHWHRRDFIQQRMMDLPESYRAMLPASEDDGRLIDAMRAIREQFAADQTKAAATSSNTIQRSN